MHTHNHPQTPADPTRRKLLCAGALAGIAPVLGVPAAASAATASAYPSKAIKLVIGIAAGSTTDLLARISARHLSEALGQPVVIENRAGAGGTLGAAAVASAKPDGYTLLFVSSSLPTFPHFYDKLRFDPVQAFDGAGGLAQGGMVMLTRADAPWKDLQEMLAHARSQPVETVSYASAGIGSIAYLYSELFAQLSGVQFLHVPYQSSAAALADLMAGQVDFVFDGTTTAAPQVRSGRTRALAYSAGQRSPFIPEVPTMEEAGVTGFAQRTWFGFAAPAGTDPAILETISQATLAFNDAAAYQSELADAAHEPMKMSAAQFTQLVADETRMWAQTIRKIQGK